MTTIFLTLFSLISCNEGYANHDLVLLTSYKAKDMCSCVFVQQRSVEYCRRWTHADPNLATLQVDPIRKEVHTQAMQYWSGKARYVDQRHGCVLEESP